MLATNRTDASGMLGTHPADHNAVNDQVNKGTVSRVVSVTVGPAGSLADYICDGTADDVELNAVVSFVNSAGGGTVLIRAGTYNLVANVSIKLVNYVTIRGEGMGKTILVGAGISKNDTTTTYYITIEDLTINVNNVLGFNGINLATNSINFRLNRVELKNSYGSFLLAWGGCDALVVQNCIFFDGGLTVGQDNCAGSQLITTNNATIFNNNIFIKQFSQGGGLLTTGQTGNLIIQGNSMVDLSGNCYAAVSIENQTGNSKSVKVVNNYTYRVGIQFGVTGNSNRVAYGQIIGNFVDGGGIAAVSNGLIKADKTDYAEVANNILANSAYGYYLTNNVLVKASNNIVLNTNVNSAASPTDKGGFYVSGNTIAELNNNTVYDTGGTTPYGIVIPGGTGRVYLSNNKFEGPFINNAIFTNGTQNYLSLKSNRFNGSTSIGTVTTADYSDNDGLNPVGLVSVSVPASGSPVAVAGYSRTFYITAGTSTVACAVTNAAGTSQTVATIPSSGFGAVLVPANSTLTPTYTNAPTWTVQGN